MTPESARATLRDLSAAREHVAERVGSPWWYRLGAALSTACLFLGVGLVVGRPESGNGAETASASLVAVGACVAPIVLMWALSRSTGVSIDRYAQGMVGWYVVVFSMFVVAFVLQAFLDVPFALAGAGAAAFVITYDRERRIDALLRKRVRAQG